MKFYQLPKNITNTMIEPQGIPINMLVQLLKSFDGQTTLDDINDIVISPFEFLTKDSILKTGKLKHDFFAIIKKNEVIELKALQPIYLIFNNEKIHLSYDKKDVEIIQNNQNHYLNTLSEQEKKVIDWLENGKVGSSSLTLCSYLFPELNHSKIKEGLAERNTPKDSDDFKRCYLLIQAVDDGQILEKMKNININSSWNFLIENWQDLTSFFEAKDFKKCQNILDEANSKTSNKIKP